MKTILVLCVVLAVVAAFPNTEKRDDDDCEGRPMLGEKCGYNMHRRCCGDLQCSKTGVISDGRCSICKFSGAWCTDDEQCCPGLVCKWYRKCKRKS